MDNPQRYLCLSVDVVGYGRHNDTGQARLQAKLIGLLDAAAARAGLDRGRWLRQAKGDEELSLIPATEPPPRVVGGFCQELAMLLPEANRAGGRTRLRLAVDAGPALPAANGYTGQAVVGVSRLVNSDVARQALAACPQADLVIVFADGVYRDWVKSGLSAAQPQWFRAVQVSEKEFCEQAWLWVPGADTHALDLATGRQASPGETPERHSVSIRFDGPVTNRGGHNVFGIRNG